jgi:signal transduction histidine kinase
VDIALVASLVEDTIEPATAPAPAIQPVSPELLVPRLGDYLVERGWIDRRALEKALQYQREKTEKGQPILLGNALLELGLLDRNTLDRAVTEQIYKYQIALQRANQELEARVQERTKELQKALERLTELNRLKSNFISNISHELRTPLAHIKGYIELLADGSLGEINDEQREALKTIRRAYNRLENLIEDLIRYSMTTQGKIFLNLAPLDVPSLLRSVELQSRPKAQQRGIQLRTLIPKDIPPVQGDEEKITWVLLHLVDNAIKFTDEGGKVVLSAHPSDSQVTLAVTDSGIGIPADRVEEIFEPFHQLDGSARA